MRASKKFRTIALVVSCLSLQPAFSADAPDSSDIAHPEQASTTPAPQSALYSDISDATINAILRDHLGRVSPAFHVPEEAIPLVGFWFRIYAKYSLYHQVVYDSAHHDKIYEVVDGRDLFEKGLGPIALEISLKKRTSETIAKYRAALQKLKKNPGTSFEKGTPGYRLVAVWGRLSKKGWSQADDNLRVQAGQRDRVMQGLVNADRFFPSMESIFKKFEVPIEITRLPMVESSFNYQAVSKVDAVGAWQFLEKSAKEYLLVDERNKIDERLSPIKSAYAAARMFKRNHKLLRDWGLAIIAYNHGARNLIPIRNKYQGQNIAKLLTETKHTPLGYASRSFYACFLAMLHAERYRDALYGIPKIDYSNIVSIVRMKRSYSIFDIASIYNISIHELRTYNPDIFDLKRKLPTGTRVVVPKKISDSLVRAGEKSDPRGSRKIASDPPLAPSAE